MNLHDVREVLEKNAETFEEYAELHRKKGPGHEHKVQRNEKMAKLNRDAIREVFE